MNLEARKLEFIEKLLKVQSKRSFPDSKKY